MTRLVHLTIAGDVAEGEQIQELLLVAGIESRLEAVDEHDADALDDPPLNVLVAESDVEDARDAIEALTEIEDEEEEEKG
ncbi:MAG TPA: hypothetical protein VLA69_02910 [Gaiellaceae bacterium]|nr:hypothetical protein [Gaiellaceae bacterium]